VPASCGVQKLAEKMAPGGGSQSASGSSPGKRRKRWVWEPGEDDTRGLYQALPFPDYRHPGRNDQGKAPHEMLATLRAFATAVVAVADESDVDADRVAAYRTAAAKTGSKESLKLLLTAAGVKKGHALYKESSAAALAKAVSSNTFEVGPPPQPRPLTQNILAATGLPKLTEKRRGKGFASAGHESEVAVERALADDGVADGAGVKLTILDIRNPGIVKDKDHPTMSTSLDELVYLDAKDAVTSYEGLAVMEQKSAQSVATAGVFESIGDAHECFSIVDLREWGEAAIGAFHAALADWKHGSQIVHACGVFKVAAALYTLATGVNGDVCAVFLFLFNESFVLRYSTTFHTYVVQTMPWQVHHIGDFDLY
jgi:hypothetical protein